ncbi:AMP-binding protein [Streptomyces sp. E11-3]|uniref:AMP-binding protein n=1 Tax=Streptomyces sp. E11-3 TaxID=3110112 RepID=UPI00397FA629
MNSLMNAVTRHARRTPRRPALVWRGAEVSYGALGEQVERYRALIRGLDGAQGEPLALIAKKSPAAVALITAALMEHRPLLLPSAELGRITLNKLVAQAGCRHVLTVRPEPGAEVQSTLVPGASPVDHQGAALMLTTSGSTGTPKIVPLPPEALIRFTGWAAGRFGIREGSSVFNYAPLNFDLCLLDIWTTLRAGGRVVLVDQDQAANPAHLRDLLSTTRPDVVQAVPMLYRLLADPGDPKAHRFPGVKKVINTGEAPGSAVLAALPELFPDATFYNLYGCTETNDSFLYEFHPDSVASPRQGAAEGAPLPIGTPVSGVRYLVLASDKTVLTGAGEGELVVSTPFQSRGYLNAPEAAEAFAAQPGSSRSWYHTGDVVRRDDSGVLTLVGRTDHQVKVRGVRINLQDVEQTLLEHEAVAEAAVVALADPDAGKSLCAVVRRVPGSGLGSLQLREHCAKRLARAAIPAKVHITDDALPRTGTGKVDRQAITHRLTRRR